MHTHVQNQPQAKIETTVMMVTNASVEDLNAAILCLRAAEANKYFTETDTIRPNRNETQNRTTQSLNQ